ncbi:peptide chain release factor 1 (bRF-1) [Alicyclobacillus sacchari]|uniref:Peptide chain release factor 1 n=1 Tax=Alicyclobacillus sacchari TaxID=392010 RepID=A0A4R8LRI6_9BACL|nr:peptide chain release factor 1 [Alicyclobacillus sacchari]TDY50114.1 peptide chain release factor 1 (bRF-1) [Alicyclobacillus sacchari]GMA57524.1 peptide chain release factor 1 [Alicyclobacillus sacchari]
MFERLASMEERFEHLSDLLCRPEVMNNPGDLRTYAKEQADLAETVAAYRQWKQVVGAIEEAKAMLQEKLDDEMRDFVRAELEDLQAERLRLEEQLQILLLPKDPNDDKDVFLEIRAAAGGEEAALFAGTLLRMYQRYAEANGWKVEVIDANYTDMGGFREVTMAIHGKGAFSKLKFESGTHRVQRVPVTESGGRIHTSTATVAVLPEVEEVEIDVQEKDIRIDTFCSTGPGGQSVNTTQSAVRITHLPTGIVVSCQDEKSQLKNREKAMRVLRARLYEKAAREQQEEQAAARRSQVGTGDRSERIRTYNFPQSRVTDHRIGLTLHRLEAVLDGDLDEIIQGLIVADRAAMLQAEEA